MKLQPTAGPNTAHSVRTSWWLLSSCTHATPRPAATATTISATRRPDVRGGRADGIDP